MGRTAVAVVSSRALPASAKSRPDPDVEARLETLSKQLGYGRHLRPGRSHVAFIVLIVVGAWVVFSFGKTITSLNTATERQGTLTAETVALNAQLDAGRRELELVQTDAYQSLQARAYGIGAPGEIAFSLEDGSPLPPQIRPLGAPGTETEQKPLDAWLRLLFGD